MEIPKGYKQTEVGVIPQDWDVRSIKSLASKLVVGFVGTCEQYYTNSNGVLMIRTGDLKESYIDTSTSKYVTLDFHERNKKSQLKKGDVLIARHGSNGHGVIYDYEEEANALNIVIIRTNESLLDNRFLVYSLKSSLLQSQIEESTAGSTQKVINTRAIGELQLLLPSIDEQKRIADVLSHIDKLIAGLGEQIEKKRQIKEGAMQQLLTGKTRLKGFSGLWMEKKIEDVCEVKRGVRVTREFLSLEGEYPVFQNTNYPLGLYHKYNVEANTPFVIIGGSAGLVGFCNTNYWAADDCAYFANCKTIDKNFLYYNLLLRQGEIKSHVRTASVPRLDRKIIEKMELLIPSFEEQSAIAHILSDMDNEIAALEAERNKYTLVKQGMMQELLTGKTRLV